MGTEMMLGSILPKAIFAYRTYLSHLNNARQLRKVTYRIIIRWLRQLSIVNRPFGSSRPFVSIPSLPFVRSTGE